MDKANFLMVEDDVLLRDGFTVLLKREHFVRNIYEAATAEEVESHLANHTIDIILLDIHLGKAKMNGMDLLLSLQKKPVQPKVIVVTGLEGVELVLNLLKTNVDAIVSKLDGFQDVRKATLKVMQGGKYFPQRVLDIIRDNAYRLNSVPPVTLSDRDKELLKAMASGLTTKEIAVQFKMTEATAETYRIRLVKRVGAPNTAALIAYAYTNGIL